MIGLGRQLVRHHELLGSLTRREITARYRGSLLGFIWSFVQPLLLLAVYSFVFGQIFAPRVAGADPYPLFLVCGLFPWIWFSSALSEGTLALVANSGLIRRSVFPLELLPIVPVLSNLVQLLLALPVVAAGIFLSRLQGHEVGGWGAVAVPLVIMVQLPLVSGLSLALSALHAHYKDVRDLLSSILTLLFFLTPVIYPVESVVEPWIRWIVSLSPATSFTIAWQRTLFEGRFPEPALWLQMTSVSLLGFALGAFVFSRLRETLVEAL